MRKILALLLFATSLSAVPRALSPERGVGDPKPLTNQLAGGSIDIASDGDTALAVWTYKRSGGLSDIVATRLNDAGEAPDPAGILVTSSLSEKQLLRVIWDGHRYLIVWGGDDAIWVSTLNGNTTRLFEAPQYTSVDLVARPGGGTIVMANANHQLVVRAYDDDFRLLNTQLLDNRVYASRIVRSGNAIVAVWAEEASNTWTVFTQRLDELGFAVGLPGRLAAVSGSFFDLVGASSANRAYIAFGANLLGAQSPVQVLAIEPNGVIDPVTTYDAIGISGIAATPEGGFVTGETSGGVTPAQLRRFDSNGTPIDHFSLGSFEFPILATMNSNVISASFGPAPVSYVYGALRTKTISFVSPAQTQPRLATDGTNMLLVWFQLPGPDIRAQLLAPSGQPLHEALNLGNGYGDANPVAGFDGTTYYVVHADRFDDDHTELRVRRIARDGSLDGDPFIVAKTTGHVTNLVAAGNAVAWLDDETFPQPRVTWASLDARVPIVMSTATHLVAASNGSNVLFASITPSDTIVVAPPGGGDITIPTQTASDSIALGGYGDRWLLTYFDGSGIIGQFLQRDGTASGAPFRISNDQPDNIRVAWDGDEFVVTWDSHNMVQIVTVRDRDVEPQLIPFSQGPQRNGDAVFVNSVAILAYQHRTPEATNSMRVFTRVLARPRMRTIR